MADMVNLSGRLRMLVPAVLFLAGCHLIYTYEDNPDAAPILDLGKDASVFDKSKDKGSKKDTATKKETGTTPDKAIGHDQVAFPPTWKNLTPKGASWASTVSPVIWGRSLSEIYIGAGFNLYKCSDQGGTTLSCIKETTSVGIIHDVGGYAGEVYAVGSGGMVLAKANKWKSIFTTLSYHFTGIWCDGMGNCILSGLGGSPPNTGGAIVNFKGTTLTNDSTFSNVKQLNAVWSAGGTVATVGSDCSFMLNQSSSGTWGTIKVQGLCNQQLNGVWGEGANYFIAVGSGGVLVRWTVGTTAYVTSVGGQALNAVWGANKKAVWAVGQKGRVAFHNGSGWKDRSSGITGSPDLSDVWGLGASHVYAVGPNSVIVRYK